MVQDKPIPTQEQEKVYDVQCTHTETDPIKYFKSAQTSFSTTDVTRETYIQPNNTSTKLRSKSQDNTKSNKELTEDVIHECLNELQLLQKGTTWSKKLEKLAKKLKEPGGEDKLKHKIKKYLNRFPSNFDKDDEDGQRFREQLPDYIVHRLKKTFAKQGNSSSRSPFLAMKKEKNQANLKTIVKAWIKILPLMKEDYLGRVIKKDDILENITSKLEPFISYRPKSDRDFKNMLTLYIMEITSTMPLSYDLNKEKEYVTSIVDELVGNILAFEKHGSIKRNLRVKKCESIQNVFGLNDPDGITEELGNFIADELEFILKESDIALSKNINKFVESEIMYLFSEAIQSPRTYRSKGTKLYVRKLLQEICNLPELQASYFSEELVNSFKYIFLNNLQYNSRTRYSGAYSEACLVYYVPHIKFTRTPLLDKIVDKNVKEYAKKIWSYIDRWLCTYRMHVPLIHHQTFKNVAISELTEAIVNRHLYLKRHDSNRGTGYDEQEHMEYLILKWIHKLVGKDNIKITQHVPELLQNLQNLTFNPDQNIKCSQSYTVASIPKTVYDYKQINELVNDLYEEILVWYADLPQCLYSVNDKTIKRNNINQLASDIVKGLENNVDIDELIDKNVDVWIKKVLKTLPRSPLIEELKAKIKIIVFEKTQIKIDSSLQTRNDVHNFEAIKYSFCSDPEYFTRKVIIEINQWLSDIHLSIQSEDAAQAAIENLALDIIDRYKYLELNPGLRGTDKDELENLKYQVFKWLNSFFSENKMKPVEHASKLMQRLQRVILSTENVNIISSSEKLHTNNVRNLQFCNLCNRATSVKSTTMNNKCDRYSNTEIINSNTLKVEGINKLNNSTHKSSGTAMETTTLQLAFKAVRGQDCDFFERLARIDASRKNNHLLHVTDSSSRYTVHNKSYHPSQCVPDTFYPYCDNSYSAFTINSIHEKPNSEKVKMYQVADFTTKYYTPEVYTKSTSENNATVETTNKTNFKPSMTIPELNYSMENGSFINVRLSQTYEYFDQIFRERCDGLPVDNKILELKALGENTKRRINNTIWKTFFKLKEDPSIKNNNTLLVTVLEDQLDELVDCLPQTDQMIEFRSKWKDSLIKDVLRLLNCVSEITPSASFRQQLAEMFYSNFIKQNCSKCSDKIQYILTIKIVDAFILYTKFKADHSFKANFYKQCLMKNISDLLFVNSKEEILNQRDQNKFCENALKFLSSITIPDTETLKNEAGEILIGDVIEQWYDSLPVASIQDKIFKYKANELLRKKFVKISKICKTDINKTEEEMLRETIDFLKTRDLLFSLQDVYVKAQELVNEVKNKVLVDDYMMLNELSVNGNLPLKGTETSKLEVNKIGPKTSTFTTDEGNSTFEDRILNSAPAPALVPVNLLPNMILNKQAYIKNKNPSEFDPIGIPYRPLSCNESIEFERESKSTESEDKGTNRFGPPAQPD